MGYTTSTPENIDFSYKMPESLMIQAISNADQQVDNVNNQTDAYDKYINSINSLSPDKARLDEINKGYRNQIENVRTGIQSNPANYREYLPQIRQLSRTLLNNKELQTIQSRYKQVTDWQTEHDKLAQEGKIDPTLYDIFKSQHLPSLIQSTSYTSEKGFGNISLPNISKGIDWAKKNEEYIKDMKPVTNAAGTVISKDGQWLVETTEGRKYVSPERIKQTWLNNYMADPEAQRSTGQYNNYVGDKVGTNIADNAMKAAMNKYSFSEGAKTKIAQNPVDKMYFEANNKVNEDKLKRQHQLQDQEHDDHNTIAELSGLYEASKTSQDPDDKTAGQAAYNQAKYMGVDLNAIAKDVKISAGNNNQPIISTPKVTKDTTIQNPNGSVVVNYFNGQNALTPNNVFAKIQSTQNQINKLDSVISNIPDTPEREQEKAANIDARRNQQDILNNVTAIQGQSKDYAFSEMKKKGYNEDDITLAKKPSTFVNIDNKKKELQIRLNNNREDVNAQENYNYILKAEKYYKKILEDYNSTQDKWFKDNNGKSSQSISYIGIDNNKAKIIANLIDVRPKEFKIIDPETGTDMSSQVHSEHDFRVMQGVVPRQNDKFNYSLDTDNESSLGSYIKKNGKKVSDIINITGISAPIAGYGTTATAKINAPGLDPKKNYLIKIPTDVAISYATQLKPKDATEAKIQEQIVDREKGDLKSELLKMYNGSSPMFITRKTRIQKDEQGNISGGKNISMKVIPVNVDGNIKYNLELSTDGGNTYRKDNTLYQSLDQISDAFYSTPKK